jgi:AcrR family transcriptional regulator
MAKRRSPEPISTIEDRLLRASVALGDSLDTVSLPELAAAAQIAVGTLYRIAPSKSALAEILDARARAYFERHVFTPFPARLSLAERFHLMWSRLGDFAIAEPGIAAYLARKPMAPDSAFIKASAVFARDGAATGELKAFGGEELAALVWGPLSALLRNRACSVESLKQLEQATWDGLSRNSSGRRT